MPGQHGPIRCVQSIVDLKLAGGRKPLWLTDWLIYREACLSSWNDFSLSLIIHTLIQVIHTRNTTINIFLFLSSSSSNRQSSVPELNTHPKCLHQQTQTPASLRHERHPKRSRRETQVCNPFPFPFFRLKMFQTEILQPSFKILPCKFPDTWN